jgi:FlaA1/EpsC-like NDP-sugar epimerase
MVRFGNVLGSSGSVVPRFKEQIASGGPVTLTHKDIIRYFMTIPEAAQLVIQAGSMAKGGEVFVLDMGKPVKIYDLACTLINLSGLTVRNDDNPDGDIAIEEIGLRPGEKLFEELLIGENPMPTKHQRIMQAMEGHMAWRYLSPALDQLEKHVHDGNRDAAVSLLRDLVPEYQPNVDSNVGASAA